MSAGSTAFAWAAAIAVVFGILSLHMFLEAGTVHDRAFVQSFVVFWVASLSAFLLSLRGQDAGHPSVGRGRGDRSKVAVRWG